MWLFSIDASERLRRPSFMACLCVDPDNVLQVDDCLLILTHHNALTLLMKRTADQGENPHMWLSQ